MEAHPRRDDKTINVAVSRETLDKRGGDHRSVARYLVGAFRPYKSRRHDRLVVVLIFLPPVGKDRATWFECRGSRQP